MSTPGARARPRPCASCPYRCDVPSGVWASEEYDKLADYDGEIADQAAAGGVRAFFCHQADGRVCAGWLGHRDPADLLAVRLGVTGGWLHISVVDYVTDVALFASGRLAAEHGKARIEAPGEDARDMVAKLVRTRDHHAASARASSRNVMRMNR